MINETLSRCLVREEKHFGERTSAVVDYFSVTTGVLFLAS